MKKLLALLLIAGCSSRELELGPQWRPLESVRESKVMAAGLGGAGARTIGETVWVADLKEWKQRLPEGVLRDAVLAHEQVHSQRQEERGVVEWLTRYTTSSDFAWEEEQLGWYAQIQYLRGRGQNIDAAAVARTISNYSGPWGDMVSARKARQWVDAVLAGQWKPPP